MDDVHVLFRLYFTKTEIYIQKDKPIKQCVTGSFQGSSVICVTPTPPTDPPHPPPLPTYFKEGAEAAVKPLCCTEEAFTVHTQISFTWPHHACNRHPAGTSGELQGAN